MFVSLTETIRGILDTEQNFVSSAHEQQQTEEQKLWTHSVSVDAFGAGGGTLITETEKHTREIQIPEQTVLTITIIIIIVEAPLASVFSLASVLECISG